MLIPFKFTHPHALKRSGHNCLQQEYMKKITCVDESGLFFVYVMI